MPMKIRSVFPLLIATGILVAQLPCSQAQDKDVLKFVHIASDVATNLQPESIDGYTAIYIDAQNWSSASTDSELGPFVQAQEASATHSMACLFSPTRGYAVCVYFDSERAYGLSALKSDLKNPFTASGVAASYKPITRELLRKAPGTFAFSPININFDNGQALVAYQIKLDAH